jgi:hypothetical protein
MSWYAQAKLLSGSLTSTQPPFVCFPVTGSGFFKDSTTLSRNEIGSDRRLPLTRIVQTLLSGDGEGRGLGLSEFVAVCLAIEAEGGATDLRVEMPIAKAKIAKAAPIPTGRSNFLGKVEAEGGLICEPAKSDEKFTAGVKFVGARAGICMSSGNLEGSEFSSLSLSD